MSSLIEKISLKYLYMGDQAGQWLVGEFTVFGIHFQNWMPLAVGIVFLFILYQWLRASRH